MIKFNKSSYLKNIKKLNREQLLQALIKEAQLRYKYQKLCYEITHLIDQQIGGY